MWSWWLCVCVCVFSMGVLSRVLPTRARTKKEHTPPFSQVPFTMTGKVIDYTAHWADRAKQVQHGGEEAQRRAGSGWREQHTPHQPAEPRLNQPLINFSCELTHNVKQNEFFWGEDNEITCSSLKEHTSIFFFFFCSCFISFIDYKQFWWLFSNTC